MHAGKLRTQAERRRRHAKLEPHRSFLLAQVAEKADITMPELAAELAAATGEKADPASLSRWLIRAGYRFKKKFCAPASTIVPTSNRRAKNGPAFANMRLEPDRLVFVDETGTTTKMTRLRGRCPKGQRLLSKAPFGHWKTRTFVAGLRCGALTAPFVIDAPMDRRIFETYVETQLAPTLQPGDVVILDNLPAHKRAAAEAAIRAKGAWFLFLPPTAKIQSRWLSQSSRPCCAPKRSGPSTPSGQPSEKSAISSLPKNAKTTSPPQVTDSYESPASK